MMFPGDAMNQRFVLLYGPGEYRHDPSFYEVLIEGVEGDDE